jgi:hypothetical protein
MLSVVALIFGWIWKHKALKKPFIEGFLMGSFSWMIVALGMQIQNGFELSIRLTETFMLPHVSGVFVIQGLIGGLLGASGMMVGYMTKTKLDNQ